MFEKKNLKKRKKNVCIILVRGPVMGGRDAKQESGDTSSVVELSSDPLVRPPAVVGTRTMQRPHPDDFRTICGCSINGIE